MNNNDGGLFGLITDFIHLFSAHSQTFLTVLRQPTPIKITTSLTADGSGVIGGGLFTPRPIDIYQTPMSHEAWINRISISSPSGTPRQPLTTGEIWCTGSTNGEPIFFAPVSGNLAPIIITEGRLSAAHLNPGERLQVVADFLPAFTALRFDLQLVLVSGVSPDIPLPRHISIPAAITGIASE